MKFVLSGLLCLNLFVVFSQQKSDTTLTLNEVTVKAFEANRSISEVAAPVHIIEPKAIERFDNIGILPILNLYPGVQMEERSPGSYRISIRGSSVRSPFGVRNVKVYWNEIPFTDANGVSYFNLLDINSLNSIEILKGPSASIYGAGMGGVILLDGKSAKTKQNTRNSLNVNTHLGSYNTQNRTISFTAASSKVNTYLAYSHAGTDGYRDHSKMRRDVFNYRSSLFLADKYTLHLNGFYSDIYYQTPGGLTIDQRNNNPRDARLATRFTPSSDEQKAAIYQKMLSLGLSQELKFTDKLTSTLSIFGNNADLKNPFITNYEIRSEKSFGLRNKNVLVISESNIKSKAVFGVEYQKTNSDFDVYDNNGGERGGNQYHKIVDAYQTSIFAQIEAELPSAVFMTGGLSLNKQTYNYQRIGGLQVSNQTSGVPVMPRLSVLKSFGNPISIFASISKGFSPPTVQEFATIFQPLSNVVTLDAESGTNLEFGLKGESGEFSYQANIYSLQMNDAIVRGSISDQDIFSNAGKASQKGLELLGEYQKSFSNLSEVHVLMSSDFKDYKYIEFTDQEKVFDGNQIPSVPKKTFNLVIDYALKNGLFWNNNLNFTDKTPLDNANTVFADSYYLLSSRIGWKKAFNLWLVKVYLGGDNLLDEKYSLGNDINAFGNRYYNPSPKRNWNGGVAASFSF